MNRYKIKAGATVLEVERFVAKNKEKCTFEKGGNWISKNAEFYLTMPLLGEISLNISFPNNLQLWNDVDNVLVRDNLFDKPYAPFYCYEHGSRDVFPFLKTLIETYNEEMNKMPFLEKINDI